jgi:hypothetical protein
MRHLLATGGTVGGDPPNEHGGHGPDDFLYVIEGGDQDAERPRAQA